jgi:GNAT superfamily N-acetyltransferase
MGAMRMAEVRFWRQEDLPYLRWFAAVNAWQILPPDDRALASIGHVAMAAETNLFEVLRSPGGTALVAEADGRPVGYLLIGINVDPKTGQRSGYMADIYIDPAYRSQGIASRFHQMSEQYLTDMGIRKATLWTHAHNPLGQKSAERQGYRLWGMVMAKILQDGRNMQLAQPGGSAAYGAG